MTHRNFVEGGLSKNLRCWTDYPLHKQLGKKSHGGAVYVVNVLAYDGDKYVKVETDDGQRHIIKAGYLCADPTCAVHGLPQGDFDKVLISNQEVYNDARAVADPGLAETKRSFERAAANHAYNAQFQETDGEKK